MSSKSLRKQRQVSPPTSSDESSSIYESQEAIPPTETRPQIRDPLWGLRRTNTIVGLLGAGCLSIGSCLVIALYVTGLPRLDDLATSVTAILFFSLVGGCIACLPSWIAASIVLFGQKPSPETFPPHAKLLRLLYLVATLTSTLYANMALVLYVLLQEKESFVDFCLLNLPNETEGACTARWNRNWLIILSVALVLLYHISFGFPLYRYTRGPQGGTQLKEGLLLELAHRDNEVEEKGLRRVEWSSSDSDSDSSYSEKHARSHRSSLSSGRRMPRERLRTEEW